MVGRFDLGIQLMKSNQTIALFGGKHPHDFRLEIRVGQSGRREYMALERHKDPFGSTYWSVLNLPYLFTPSLCEFIEDALMRYDEIHWINSQSGKTIETWLQAPLPPEGVEISLDGTKYYATYGRTEVIREVGGTNDEVRYIAKVRL